MVNEEAVEKFDRRLDLRNMDRSSRWATVATRLAMREAGFPEKPAALAELGFFLHLSAGPSWAESEFLTSFLGHDHQVSQLVAFPFIVPCSVAGNVCRALRLTGHNLTLSAGPGAGLLGLGPAVAALRSGHTQALLSGAVDELSERILTDNFMAGLVAKDGIPPGEGAAVLLLETVLHAEARGAKPLATIRGLAFSTKVADCHSYASPTSAPPPHEPRFARELPTIPPLPFQRGEGRGEGLGDDAHSAASLKALEETVHEALAQASIAPEQVSAVCACGPRSRIEPLIARICPAWAERIVAVSQHTGCAEGAQPLFDLAAALLAPPENPARPPFILAIVSTPPGSNGAVVFQRVLGAFASPC
jgi:3-oxoacyl-(acyl-carrier-protein) synthase